MAVGLSIERSVSPGVLTLVPRFPEVGAPTGCLLSVLLRLDPASPEVQIEQLRGDPLTQDRHGGRKTHPQVPARMLDQVHYPLRRQLRLVDRGNRHRVLGHLVEVPLELRSVQTRQLNHADFDVALLVDQLGHNRFAEPLYPLLYRYTGAAKEEHPFVACTFWMIEALSIGGRTEEAGALLEGALALANDVGLWSEEIDPADHRLKGNFPIGISHLAVIGAITSFSARMSDRY
jgi:hypothetical protein